MDTNHRESVSVPCWGWGHALFLDVLKTDWANIWGVWRVYVHTQELSGAAQTQPLPSPVRMQCAVFVNVCLPEHYDYLTQTTHMHTLRFSPGERERKTGLGEREASLVQRSTIIHTCMRLETISWHCWVYSIGSNMTISHHTGRDASMYPWKMMFLRAAFGNFIIPGPWSRVHGPWSTGGYMDMDRKHECMPNGCIPVNCLCPTYSSLQQEARRIHSTSSSVPSIV